MPNPIPNTWQILEFSEAFTSRYQAGSALGNGRFHVMGGYWTVTENLAYDAVLNTWTAKQDLPGSRGSPQAVALGGYIWLIGGWDTVNNVNGTNVWRFDPVGNTWTTTYAAAPIPNGLAVADPTNNEILYGGWYGTDWYSYAVATDTWSLVFTGPGLSAAGAVVTHSTGNGRLYFQNGLMFSEYDPVTRTFTTKTTNAPDHFYHSLVSHGGKIWAIGGLANLQPEDGVSSYDHTTNTWQSEAPLKIGRFQAVAQEPDGRMMIVAGEHFAPADGTTFPTNAEVYIPIPDSEAMLEVPMNLYPAKIGTAVLTLAGDVSATEMHIDPRRLDPGFLQTGHRPPGYKDPVFLEQYGNPIPLPLATDTTLWTRSGSTPNRQDIYQIDEYSYVVDGQFFYVITGYWSPSDQQWWSDRIYRFDAQTGHWAELTKLPGWVGSEGSKAGLIDGKIYVVMGDTGAGPDGAPFCAACDAPQAEFDEADTHMLQSLWIYDIAGDSWTHGPTPPWFDSYGAAAVLDGKLYLAQMYGQPNWLESTGFAVFDPVANTWTTLADQIVTPWDAPAMWAGDGKIWMSNRDVNDDTHLYITSYDPGTDSWTEETMNFDGWAEFTTLHRWPDGAAVIHLSDTTVALIGGFGTDNVIGVELDYVNKTAVESSLRWPSYLGVTADFGYYGGMLYDGYIYVTGPRSWVQTPAHPAGMWRAPR
jgi:Kelch motif